MLAVTLIILAVGVEFQVVSYQLKELIKKGFIDAGACTFKDESISEALQERCASDLAMYKITKDWEFESHLMGLATIALFSICYSWFVTRSYEHDDVESIAVPARPQQPSPVDEKQLDYGSGQAAADDTANENTVEDSNGDSEHKKPLRFLVGARRPPVWARNFVFNFWLGIALAFGASGLHIWLRRTLFSSGKPLLFFYLWLGIFCMSINAAAWAWDMTDFRFVVPGKKDD